VRLAVGLFSLAAAGVFSLALIAYLIVPAYAKAALHAVMDFYQARADWVFDLVSGLAGVLINNSLAALIASSLGVVGALLVVRCQTGEAVEAPTVPWSDRLAQALIHGLVASTAFILSPVRQIRDLPARTAVAIAILAPSLSLICNGALLGIWLGTALTDEQMVGVLKALLSIAPHAVFELPAICLAAAVGLHLALRLTDTARVEPQRLAAHARECLTSPQLRRTWGILFLLVLIGAVLETRVSWDLQETLRIASG